MQVMLSSYSQYLELIVVLIGAVRYGHFKNTQLKYVFYLICYIALNEFFAGVCYPLFKIPNYIPYNLYYLVNYAFFIWWFMSLLKSRFRKTILKVFLGIYIICWFINAFFIQDFINTFLTYISILGAIFVTVSICFYFVEMMAREVIMNITRSPYFWVAFGLLVFCVTFLPLKVSINIMQREHPALFSMILFLINVIQYCCFSIAFVVADNTQKKELI